MTNNNSILAIIPARQGSKGLKNKNIKVLKNLPLIAWSILAAKKCKKISEIIVKVQTLKKFLVFQRNMERKYLSCDLKNLLLIKLLLLVL